MKFALISQDSAHGERFWINPEKGDATSFMNWVDVLQGFHFSFEKLRADMSMLKNFDLVMMSGNPHNLKDITNIAKFLKDTKTVSMFWPEGSTQLYDGSINHFAPEIYEAWNACDILSIAEEDKRSYYEAFVTPETSVNFIHVPMRQDMQDGVFFIPREHKDNTAGLVYGDNNPNHPLVAMAAMSKLNMQVIGIDIDRGKLRDIKEMFPGTKIHSYTKLAMNPFLRIMGRCYLHIYPTEWIGTAREQISCAVTGTPCIGNRDSHTQQRLFPRLGVKIYDVRSIVSLGRELQKSESFYKEVMSYALQESKFYSLKNTVARMFSAYEQALAMKSMKVVVV